jgi:hypothetical protein
LYGYIGFKLSLNIFSTICGANLNKKVHFKDFECG